MPDSGTRMGDPLNKDVGQVITALKKGARLLKYGRRGKPKFCPFRLSADESALIWYIGKDEKKLVLTQVSKIIPGQRTAVFQRYPQPDKEYQSFSLIYKDRSLDVICKDKDEAEVWFVGLKALISGENYRRRSESEGDRISDASCQIVRTSIGSGFSDKDSRDIRDFQIPIENFPASGSEKVSSDGIAPLSPIHRDSISGSLGILSSGVADNPNSRSSGAENTRVSASSAVSSSSHGSAFDDFDALSDVFIWGEVTSDGVPGDGLQNIGSPFASKMDALLPKQLQAVFLLDVQHIACGGGYAALVTKQGEVYSWGEELGGRLGHGVDAYVSHPKRIDALTDINVQFVACGEHHTCAVTLSGDLYTWGDGIHSCGRVGHGSEASHWIPKLAVGPLEGLFVSSVSCGQWHSTIVTSTGQLFTFGDGIFGALGHGDHKNANIPREVEAFRGLRTLGADCGVWHTAAIVEIVLDTSRPDNSSSGKLFTWGDGDKGRLGHGDQEPRLVPAQVNTLAELNFCQVACGQDITIALATSGRVYTMGSSVYGQLGNPEADAKSSVRAVGKLNESFVEEIACGFHHAAVLTSTAEVYTWGKGTNGQLGHGDNDDRVTPTLVEALKGKQVKKIACGPNFTAAICVHKRVSSDDLSICCGCRLPFSFRRKRHNCYNCGHVFCNSCSCRKSVKAALAPNTQKPYRVCDECYNKIKKIMGSTTSSQLPKPANGGQNQMSCELPEKDTLRSRLSSLGSFKGEIRQRQKSEQVNRGSYSVLNERSQCGTIPNILHQSSNRMFSASVPGSRAASRSTSPVSSVPSQRYSTSTVNSTCLVSPTDFADYPRKTNDSGREEVLSLHMQIEDLTHKYRILQVELEKTSKESKEATEIAGEEAAQCNAAKEVIKSLTAQLKDMAERVAEEYVIDANGTLTEELVEPDEPGVFVTASSNPGGERYLERVHFSRKQFTKQQAEKWWADNRERLLQKHKSRAGERHPCKHHSVRKREMID